MAEITRQRIKSIYSQIKGYYENLPQSEAGYGTPSLPVDNYNGLLDQLSQAAETNFSEHKVVRNRDNYNGFGYNTLSVKMSMGAVISQLDSDYGFEVTRQGAETPPIVVTVNQSQEQVTVSLINIDLLITQVEDDEEKQILTDLKDATTRKDENAARSILKQIVDKSWELFIKVLPYVLENWGKWRG